MAFSDAGPGETGEGHRNLIETVMRNPALFSDALRSIPQQAAHIQGDLNRSVWNGSVRLSEGGGGNVAFSKTLLREISNTGSRTQAVFDQSIGNLQQTVIAAISDKVASRAAFAIDVMDRNLYERANDCRWWALDATFGRVLAEPTPEGIKRCGEVLGVINGLYTVYSNLILFDARGEIVAVSKPELGHLVGTKIEEPWVARTTTLTTTQHYAVSDFVPTPLYGGAATYIYGATVRDSNTMRAVGGVGIVFDATPQFSAMLTDALPRDERGIVMSNSFALFVDRSGRVLASSDERFTVGEPCGLSLELNDLERGAARSQIVSFGGHLYTVGMALSNGYREYKVSDGYSADVISICAAQLGQELAAVTRKAATTRKTHNHHVTGDTIEFATFYVGDNWFGLRSQDVIEAIDATGITKATGGMSGLLVGYSMHRGVAIPVLDLAQCVGVAPGEDERQIVIVRAGNGPVGLLVNALGDIPEVPVDMIVDMDTLRWDRRLPVSGLVRQRADDDPRAPLLIILDLARLGEGAGLDGQPRQVAAE
jgi:chemotaxis signal transduction protein